MKRTLCVLLVALMLIALLPAASFAANETTTLSEMEEAAILSQRRDLAEAHMRKICSIIWRSETDMVMTVEDRVLPEAAGEYFFLEAGRLYQGLPYSFSGGSYGSWEEILTDPDENGVYAVEELNWQMVSGTGSAGRLGTDCSGAVTQSWSQIGSSAKPQSTRNMTPKYGYLHVGEYTTSNDTMDDSEIAAIDAQVMFRAYAQMQKADALVHNGHVRMTVSVDVVYNDDGTINGTESKVTYLEQSRQHMREDRYHYDETLKEDVWELCGVDLVLSFQSLYNYKYRPITCLELIDATAGQDAPEVKDSLAKANYGYDTLLSGTLTTTNWLMDTVEMTITDKAGKTIQQGMIVAPRSGKATRLKLPMSLFATDAPTQMFGYIAPDALEVGQYHCKVVCRLTTGQAFTVRDFDFDVTTAKNDIHKVQMDFTQSTVYDCPMCGAEDAQWQPLTTDYVGSGKGPTTGHYYLPESMENNSSYISTSGQTVCLHLNGKNINSQVQALSVSTSNDIGGVLNVMGDGIVSGTKPSTAYFGAALQVSGGTANLYGGTYRHNKNTDTADTTQRPVIGVRNNSTINIYDGVRVEGDPNVKRSNILMYYGRVNMYGGEVVNGYGTNGGNFLVGYDRAYNLNYLCIYGGKITGGTASGMGGNIYAVHDSFVFVYDGEISNGNAAKGGNLAVNTGGNMRLFGGSVTNGQATELGGGIYGTNTTTKVTSKTQIDETTGELLVQNLYLKDCGVVISPSVTYDGENYTENNAYVRQEKAYTQPQLQEDLEQLTLSGDLVLDLNGYHVSKVDTNGFKLTVFDSSTDDYSVADGKYGTVPAGANVQAAEGYLAVTEAGKTSFHKYELEMVNLVVKPSKQGITYESHFRGDEMVKAQIKEFGVAMRAYNAPNETSVWADPGCLTHVARDNSYWLTGDNDNELKSVYVEKIISAELNAATNQGRSNVKVYGSAYIQLVDGTMIFGNASGFSLQEAMEHMDSYFNSQHLTDAKRQALVEFYQTEAYHGFMQNWYLPNIQAAAGENAAMN